MVLIENPKLDKKLPKVLNTVELEDILKIPGENLIYIL